MNRPAEASRTTARAIRVWDLPLRLFHWLFALAFGAAWLSTGDRWLFYHVFAGYAFAALWLFRLAWGVAGEEHARWRNILARLRAAPAYLHALRHGRAARHLGHNPAGSWAVLVLLSLAAALALTGVITLGGQEQEGPLAGWMGFAAGARARQLHELTAWALLAAVGLHLIGVALESLAHRENLPAAMLGGRKRSHAGATDSRARTGIAALLLLALALGSGAYFRAPATHADAAPFRPYTGPQLARDATWQTECGSCHLAYHPNLLPARSWTKLLAGQHAHFGEDLYLDAATVTTLRRFLLANAADATATEAAWYTSTETPPAAVPLRITETPYWRRKHASIDPRYWHSRAVAGKGDCAACHLDAEAGTFRDGAMRLPPLAMPNDAINPKP